MNDKIDSLIENSVLASPPALLFKIINSLDGELSSKQIGEIVGHDPTVSVQVLKLSNSSFFGFKGQINTLDKAINILGTKTVRNIAVTTLLFTHTNKIKLHNLDIMAFWLKSFLVADLTRELAIRAGQDGDEGYIAGLLHGIGKIILYSQKQEPTDLFKSVHSNKEILAYEEEVWGINNIDLSKELLTRWNLPDDVIEVIHQHGSNRSSSLLSKCIYLACEFSNIATDYYYKSNVSKPIYKRLLKDLNIQEDDFLKFSVSIPDIIERGKAIMKVMGSRSAVRSKRRIVTFSTLVTKKEYSLSFVLLKLIGFTKIEILHPDKIDELERLKELAKQEEQEEIEEIEEVKEKKETIEPNLLTGMFRRILGKQKIEEEKTEKVEDEIVEKPEIKPINWQPYVFFDGVDIPDINKRKIKKFIINKQQSEIATPIPFLFSGNNVE